MNFKTLPILLMAGLLYSCSGNSQNNNANPTELQESQKTVVHNIDQAEFLQMQSKGTVTIIDVRTPDEVKQGYIKGAQLFADINSADFDQKIAQLDPQKTYIVYCKSGARSSRAAQMMIDAGFTNVYNLKGGISNWTGPIAK